MQNVEDRNAVLELSKNAVAQGSYSDTFLYLPGGGTYNAGDLVEIQVNTTSLVSFSFNAYPLANFDGNIQQGATKLIKPGFLTEWTFSFTMPSHDVYFNVEIWCQINEQWIMDEKPTYKIKVGTPPTYELDLYVSPDGAGYITADPDLNEYPVNTSVHLMAHPNEGYEFGYWNWGVYGEDPLYGGDEPSMVITVNQDNLYATAVFFEIAPPPEYQVNVTIHPTGAGYVIKYPDLSSYPVDEDGKYEVTLWFYSNEGYELDYWELYPGYTSTNESVYFYGNGDLDVHVYFKEETPPPPPEYEGTISSTKLLYDSSEQDIPASDISLDTRPKIRVEGKNTGDKSARMGFTVLVFGPFDYSPDGPIPPPTYSFSGWSSAVIAPGSSFTFTTDEFQLIKLGTWRVYIALRMNYDSPVVVNEIKYDPLCTVIEGAPPVIPGEAELVWTYEYPEKKKATGTGEQCVFKVTINLPDQLFPNTWVTSQINNTFQGKIKEQGGEILDLKIYMDTTPTWTTDYYVVALVKPAATATGVSFPFPWAVVIPLILIAVIIGLYTWSIIEIKSVDLGKIVAGFTIPIVAVGVLGVVGLLLLTSGSSKRSTGEGGVKQ